MFILDSNKVKSAMYAKGLKVETIEYECIMPFGQPKFGLFVEIV